MIDKFFVKWRCKNLSTHVLCERVCFVIFGSDENYLDDSILHILLHKVSMYIDVLCPVAVLGIIADKNWSHITVIGKLIFAPRKFNKCQIKISSAHTLLTATYSASVDDNVKLF